jgi:hypothetical protein
VSFTFEHYLSALDGNQRSAFVEALSELTGATRETAHKEPKQSMWAGMLILVVKSLKAAQRDTALRALSECWSRRFVEP